ncbi:MAG TPA: di-heme oxidoredictase family protein [Candidatus Angelobacter sp.]|nr:di-heme oxidoredictase family protein [Candidatus Angelobacter sp.]
MKPLRFLSVVQPARYIFVILAAALLFSTQSLFAQNDPGARPVSTTTATSTSPKFGFTFTRTEEPSDALGADGAGRLLGGKVGGAGNQGGFWVAAINVFAASATVLGGANNIAGLGPAFNGESCFQCHSFPTVGGTSGPTNFQADPNFVHDHGAHNTADLSSFITSNGPVREARFQSDGGVHELFSIEGRDDAPSGCTLAQPDFAGQLKANTLSFRIPTPTFGLGFVENTPDLTLQQNLANAQNLALAAGFTNPVGQIASGKPVTGIAGHFNRNGNDGTISRFGWKAQNKSLLLFSGEAANVELGVTNELFQNEKVAGSNCLGNKLPEDLTTVLAAGDAALQNPTQATAKIAADIENFAVFMRLNGAPGQCAFNSPAGQCFSLTQVESNGQNDPAAVASIQRGKALFGTVVPASPGASPNVGIGCVLCHTDVLTTGPSVFPSLDSKPFRPYSDFAVHAMDASLADGITQGGFGQQPDPIFVVTPNAAGPGEFRTAPLWGVGQRLFFLHDGRARDLLTAILDHAPSTATSSSSDHTTACTGTLPTSVASVGEGCESIGRFLNLPAVTPAGTTTPSQQDVLNFLRSL